MTKSIKTTKLEKLSAVQFNKMYKFQENLTFIENADDDYGNRDNFIVTVTVEETSTGIMDKWSFSTVWFSCEPDNNNFKLSYDEAVEPHIYKYCISKLKFKNDKYGNTVSISVK